MDTHHRLGMVQCKDRCHPSPKVITTRAVVRIAKFGHELVPALRNVSIVDAYFRWTRRKSIPRQRWYDHIEILEHRQHIHVIEEAAGPAVCEDQRHAPAGFRTLMYEMDALPSEMIESVQ